ncbi:ATP-dependent RNA helicase A protein-like isoform X2 [Convolutriloba macropyga]|uniref:ATP-dependent RNA helicase A protein-like isoform X2 n=1 Tax=Convolutriloba macropyga TaxID=536237 RepID=UPI003F5263B3
MRGFTVDGHMIMPSLNSTSGCRPLDRTSVTTHTPPWDQTMQTVGHARHSSDGEQFVVSGGIDVSFVAEMTVFVKELRKHISGKEHGSNKKVAAVNCALSIVRQLYHLGVIEAFTGTLSKKIEDRLPPIKVSIDPATIAKINTLLDGYGIRAAPPPVPGSDRPVSLVVPDDVLDRFTSPHQTPGSVICWSPPAPDWNPWISCNIDEGPMAFKTSAQISEMLLENENVKVCHSQYVDMCHNRRELPVFEYRERLLSMIRDNSVILVKGETGCGKTTQIPQFILEDYVRNNRGAHCNVIVTQPRRISAVSVAERIANERCEPIGDSTGYSVRFESVLPRPQGAILFCTVGTLLRKLESGLRGVSHVVVDEIHERDINSDFILIALRDMSVAFPELKIILMSATIDTTLFSHYFGDCPVIEVHGRTFPVQEYYLEDCVEMLQFVPPPNVRKGKAGKGRGAAGKDDDDEAAFDDDEDQNMNLVIGDEYSNETKRALTEMPEKELSFELIEKLIEYCASLQLSGAILVFLPGWNIIFSLLKHLTNHPRFGSGAFRILPLHSQVPREDQKRIFDPVPPGCTKVILSTNIAETSITINDVVFVIDSCKSKVKLFTAHNNMTSYTTVWASKTNLEQRRGRAGRVRAGFAFHLCSRSRFEKLPQHSTAEIFLTPLHEIALSIKLLKLGTIRDFLGRALEPPPLDAVIEAEVALKDMKALDKNEELTPLGRVLARLPVEPHIGKMLVLATLLGVGDPMCTIAALVSFPEPFDTPKEMKFLHPMHKGMAGTRCSDHVAMITAYQGWMKAKDRGDRSEMDFCHDRMLNMSTLRMVHEAKTQLRDILVNSEFDEELLQPVFLRHTGPDEQLDVLLSMLVGALYPNVCVHKEKRKLLTFDMKPALVHKSSVNNSKDAKMFPSQLFVFGEKLRTRAVTAHQMSMVSGLQLLLFGSRTVTSEFKTLPSAAGAHGGGSGEVPLIKLDDWVSLDLDHSSAASVVALRPIIEDFIMRYTSEPDRAMQMTATDTQLTEVIRSLSSCAEIQKDGGWKNSRPCPTPEGSNVDYNSGIVPPAKRPAIDGSSTLGGYDNYQEQPAYPAGRGGYSQYQRSQQYRPRALGVRPPGAGNPSTGVPHYGGFQNSSYRGANSQSYSMPRPRPKFGRGGYGGFEPNRTPLGGGTWLKEEPDTKPAMGMRFPGPPPPPSYSQSTYAPRPPTSIPPVNPPLPPPPGAQPSMPPQSHFRQPAVNPAGGRVFSRRPPLPPHNINRFV